MKKLLLTIIILGACLVGSSQNWDSVRVGNLDVDSIMLGGAKIWEKQTSQDTTDWTYEGVMTVGESNDEIPYIGYDVTRSYGNINPANEYVRRLTWTHGWVIVGEETLPEEYITFEGSVRSPTLISINNTLYYNFYPNGENEGEYMFGRQIDIGISPKHVPNPFPAVGETCEIKLRYTLAP